MFDTGYISFVLHGQIDSANNYFTVDDGEAHPIVYGSPNIYRVKEGTHKIEVTSGTGDYWTLEGKLKYDQVLRVTLELSGKDIADVRLELLRSAPMGFGLAAKRIN